MATTGAIEFSFKGDLSKLRRDLGEAARIAKSTAGQIERETRSGFDGGVAGLFRRTPERRAERAISGLGSALATGDLGAGVLALTGKITAFGLAAGVGVGLAVETTRKFHDQIVETGNAVEALRGQLSRSVSIQGGLGEGGISKEIENLDAALGELEKKASSQGTKFADLLIKLKIATPLKDIDDPKKRAQLIQEAEERSATLASKRADKELQIANLKLQAAQGQEKEAALAKIQLDYEEKRAALLLNRRGNALDLFKSDLANQVEAQAARLGVDSKFPEFHTPVTSANTDFSAAPIPGGRTAGPGESQAIVNQIESNRLQFERLNAGLPASKSMFQDMVSPGFFQDYLNDPRGTIDKTFFNGPQSFPGGTGSNWDEIGTGIDGIKQGIDELNAKIDKYWA